MRTILAAWLVCSASAASAGERIRIVTFNAEILAAPNTRASRISRFRFSTARRLHIEKVAHLVETLNPDILNLLEVTSREAVDQVVEVLHEKGLKDYRGYHVESHDSFTGLDVALVTRLKPDVVEDREIRILFSYSGDEQWRAPYSYQDDTGKQRSGTAAIRRHAVYYFTIGKHRLGFLGLHLKSNPEDAYSNALRSAEARVAQRIIVHQIVARGYSPIVLGDLNDYDPDVPDRDESRDTVTEVIANLKNYDAKQEGNELLNVAKHIVRQRDRCTSHWDRNENGAYDPGDVLTMIDHILLPKHLDPAVRRVFISRVSDLTISDHWPVVVDLDLSAVPAVSR